MALSCFFSVFRRCLALSAMSERPEELRGTPNCHYAVLGVLPTANESEITKVVGGKPCLRAVSANDSSGIWRPL